ncbi:tektin-2-like isoform X2 [Phymastichus coffea]|uniref:tektin-2-like isoform X2 n=1 Tax=Phymastichus coffea TaxID=108790 RepID=UPI00273CDBAC|nr:tektin-2-like isoform X2 [Phymastichus coffea]
MSQVNVEAYDKPLQHISLADWHAEQWELHQSANKKECESFDLRYSAKSLILETNIKTEWNNHMNNHRLADRIGEISRWHRIFEILQERLQQEIHLLIEERADTEKELELLDHPEQITIRCIAKRNNRNCSEITYDEGDIELKKELDLIEQMKNIMINDIKTASDKINRLEEIKSKVMNEIKNKSEAIKIDTENYDLNRDFPNFTYKPYALNISENSVSYANWLEHTQNLKRETENELSDTYTLRETMHITKEKSKHDVRFQQDATDYALRRRSFASRKARNELEWQNLKLIKEMEYLRKQLEELESALRAKTDDVKCVQTRLENRTYRPGFELCQDDPELGLKDELLTLQNTKEELAKKIDNTQSNYFDLEKLLDRVNNDLNNKKHSLTTDVMCLDMRTTLINRDGSRVWNETDRNIILRGLIKELPLEAKKAFHA